MVLKLEQRKVELVDQVAAKVRDRLAREKAKLAEAFVRQFYANVPPTTCCAPARTSCTARPSPSGSSPAAAPAGSRWSAS
ncbi:hypothetical protein [Aerophototrophica crusticola]|uniref:hypothetical protein n=1 Tax=Aerophototrophica crusticola TaxID=1709002 RepID=UPI00384A5182